MPILMKMLQIDRKLFYHNSTDTEIIEQWYELINNNWQARKTFDNTTINDIFKEYINDFKRYIEQYENDLPVW
jgi:predicted PolB exonuclease-like 3'-5' exonuclease